MAGCYGSSFEDRYFENKLLEHLADDCPECGQEYCEQCVVCFNPGCECGCEARGEECKNL